MVRNGQGLASCPTYLIFKYPKMGRFKRNTECSDIVFQTMHFVSICDYYTTIMQSPTGKFLNPEKCLIYQ
jgi:hypothetical protein